MADSRGDPRYPQRPPAPAPTGLPDPRGQTNTVPSGVPAYAPKPPLPSGSPPAFSGPLPAGAPAADPNYNAFAPVPPPPPATGAAQAPTAGVQPISFGVNGQHFNPTSAPFGMDMSTPGVNEQMWQNNQNLWMDSPQLDWVDSHQNAFNDPFAGESAISANLGKPVTNNSQEYWHGVQGAQNTPSAVDKTVAAGYSGPNNAQAAFDMTKNAMPGSLQPQFDAYYDRMKQKAISDANSQSAARGVYGSNAALNGVNAQALDVEAMRAKDATDFSLKDSDNQRAWLDSLSGQGAAADSSGVSAYNANVAGAKQGLDKTKTLGDIAFNADTSTLSRDKFNVDSAETLDKLKMDRLGAGVSTAFGSDDRHRGRLNDAFGASDVAQGSRETRVNTLYNHVSGMGKDVQDFVMENADKLIGGDTQMSDSELQTMLSQAADQRGWDDQTRERIFRDVKAVIDSKNGADAVKASTGGG